MPKRVLAAGNRHPFLTALVLSSIVALAGLTSLRIESQHRIDDVRDEERARAEAVVDSFITGCELMMQRVETILTGTTDYFRQRSIELGREPSQALADLDALVDRETNPAFCSAPAAELSSSTNP